MDHRDDHRSSAAMGLTHQHQTIRKARLRLAGAPSSGATVLDFWCTHTDTHTQTQPRHGQKKRLKFVFSLRTPPEHPAMQQRGMAMRASRRETRRETSSLRAGPNRKRERERKRDQDAWLSSRQPRDAASGQPLSLSRRRRSSRTLTAGPDRGKDRVARTAILR